MNLLFHYDAGENAFAMVGIGSTPTIDSKLAGGTSAASSYNYGYTNSFKINLESDSVATANGDETYGGTMGKFAFGNGTGGAGTNANRLCVASNGFTYFMRSAYSWRDQCSGAYYYAGAYSGSTTYAWAGWALGMGYYGSMAGSGDATYKIGGVKPLPDTFDPTIDHSGLADSHSKSRSVSAIMSDAGDPPAGLNVSTTAGVGPTMVLPRHTRRRYHRLLDDQKLCRLGTGTTRAQCVTLQRVLGLPISKTLTVETLSNTT